MKTNSGNWLETESEILVNNDEDGEEKTSSNEMTNLFPLIAALNKEVDSPANIVSNDDDFNQTGDVEAIIETKLHGVVLAKPNNSEDNRKCQGLDNNLDEMIFETDGELVKIVEGTSLENKDKMNERGERVWSQNPPSHFGCKPCDDKQLLKFNIKKHRHRKHRRLKTDCHHCEKNVTIKAYLIDHISKEHDRLSGKILQCSACDQVFAIKSPMIPHISTAHTGYEQHKKHKCKNCGERCKINSVSSIHAQQNDRMKTFKLCCGRDVYCLSASLQMMQQDLRGIPWSRLLSLVALVTTSQCPSQRLRFSFVYLSTSLPSVPVSSLNLYLRLSLTLLLPGHGVRPPETSAQLMGRYLIFTGSQIPSENIVIS